MERASTDHQIGRRGSDVELQILHDADFVAVRDMSATLKNLRTTIKVNVSQSKHMTMRLTVALSTLLRMPSARPTPQLVSIMRSIHHLLEVLCDEESSWQFLLTHFTARNIFTAIRRRMAKAWSLLPTTQWEKEDDDAAKEDETANFIYLQEKVAQGAPIPKHIAAIIHDQKAVVSLYHRRSSMSGWKVNLNHIEASPGLSSLPQALSGIGVIGIPTAPVTTQPQSVISSRDIFVRHAGDPARASSLTLNCADVAIFEVPPLATDPDDVEPFIIDVVHRYSWWHTSLTLVCGAYTEAVGPDGNAFVALGLVEENLELQGFERLDRTLFERGCRVSLHAAVTVALKVADAMQYARFDAPDMTRECPAAWAWAPPCCVYTRAYERCAGDLAESLDHLIGASDLKVRFSPPFFHPKLVSRWQPPMRAVCPEAYGIALLILATLTNTPPYQGIDDQDVIAASIAACAPPYLVPRHLPFELQEFCVAALATKGEGGFKTMSHCRVALMQLVDLGKDFPVATLQVEPIVVLDYGVRLKADAV